MVFDPDGLEVSPEFQFSPTDPALVPSVQSLAQAFNQHFAFVSAASEAPSEKGRPDQPARVDARLKELESSVQSIA